MFRRVFFSFHYDNDVWRANQVRNSWVTKGGFLQSGFVDAAEFEQLKRTGDAAVKRWIDNQLDGTSVTVVLLGAETLERPYVQYEILKSYEKGNGIVGVHINYLRDMYGNTSTRSTSNPIVGNNMYRYPVYFSQIALIFDYVYDDGYNNLGRWIEQAAIKAGR